MHTKHNNLSYGDNHSKPLGNVEYIHSPFCKENPYRSKMNNHQKKEKKAMVEKITHNGTLKLGHNLVKCYVTAKKTPLLSTTGVEQALGVVDKVNARKNMGSQMGQFLSTKTLEVAVRAVFGESVFQKSGKNKNARCIITTVNAQMPDNKGFPITGYTATTFSQLCDVMAIADNLGLVKTARQRIVAHNAKMYKQAFQEIGVRSAVFAAAGFEQTAMQQSAEHQQIIDKILRNAPAKREEAFFDGFLHKGIARWYDNFHFDDEKKRGTPGIAKFIHELIYNFTPEEVPQELHKRNPYDENEAIDKAHGYVPKRKTKNYLWFTPDFGVPVLKRRIAHAEAIVASSNDWKECKKRWADFKSFFIHAMKDQKKFA